MSDMSIVGQPGKFGLGVMMKKADSTTEKHRLSSAQMAIAAAIGATIILLVFYFLTR